MGRDGAAEENAQMAREAAASASGRTARAIEELKAAFLGSIHTISRHDWFAGMAIMGLLANYGQRCEMDELVRDAHIAANKMIAYKQADARETKP